MQEVKALVDVVEGTDVTSLVWTRSGHKVVIRRGQAAAPLTHVVAQASPAPVPAAHAPPPAAARAEPPPEKPGALVTSPFVGTFYRAPSPDSPPYVDVGTRVKKGQVLCIVEAMKLMNEIEAEVEGAVAEVLVQNATPVEFGQALFRIEPA
ncbi:MAG TPA: acetyl-CoA carboxylase biotin carboxyl carrier protein [Anaeromyxobacteraceae bacterium]|nr:acetyl-CoA carboxylase biotin carboxyl carrier protein [Anaeromyxobacteraceae bacterium]